MVLSGLKLNLNVIARMRLFLALYLFALCPLFCAPALAAETSIVATVNDSIITNTDVQNRMALIFLSSGLGHDAQSEKTVRDRALKNLIDEALQLQEANKNSITISKEDIDKALEKVAGQNQMDVASMKTTFAAQGVPLETLENQIRAGLSWSKVVQRVLRTQVDVGDEEVNAAIERMKANEGKPEYLISEIYLAVDNPTDEQKVKELADSLVERLKQGASFAGLAQQFSQATSAMNGGDLGWVQGGQLRGTLDEAVRKLSKGQVSLPIHTTEGYYILGKRDERIITASDPQSLELQLKQASLALNGKTLSDVSSDVESVRKNLRTCAALSSDIEKYPGWSVQDLGSKKVSELPKWLQDVVRMQSTAEPSLPMEKSGYALLLYVCARNDKDIDRNTIMNAIGNEKLDLQARRLLRDLRRAASIEIKGE